MLRTLSAILLGANLLAHPVSLQKPSYIEPKIQQWQGEFPKVDSSTLIGELEIDDFLYLRYDTNKDMRPDLILVYKRTLNDEGAFTTLAYILEDNNFDGVFDEGELFEAP